MDKKLVSRRVLMYTTGNHGAQEGAQLEEAINCIKRGYQVFFLRCDETLGGCFENPKFDRMICKICSSLQKSRCRRYLPKEVELHRVKEYVTPELLEKVKGITFEYKDKSELVNLTYKGVDIGIGALSVYISLTRNLCFDLSKEMRSYLDAFLKQQVILTEVIERIIREWKPDYMIFHNGRYAQFKPVLNCAQKHNIDFLCTEFLVTSRLEVLKNYFDNDVPHSSRANQIKYNALWDELKDFRERENIARSFFENKRNAVYAGDTVYTKNQLLGKLPSGWREDLENIVIFNSSEDEFCAISREVDAAALFKSQLEGLKNILNHYQHDEKKHFYLRIHPNLAKVKYKYHTDLYKLKYRNFSIIPADSPISTYSLIDFASKIIVFGSTVGIEATYWRKPAICLAFAFYGPLDVVYCPSNENELWKLLDTKDLPHKYNENVLKYGLFYMYEGHERFRYINCNFKAYKILGKNPRRPLYQKIWGSSKVGLLYSLIKDRWNMLCYFTCCFKKIPLKES